MRKYFEYEFNDEIKDELLAYYNSVEGMDDFDDGGKKTALKINRISKYIPFDKNDIICDIGCADAELLRYLNGKYKKATGYDISEKVIKDDLALGLEDVEFLTYDGAKFSANEPYDKIFLMDVLEHSFDPDTLMKSIYENLKMGGYL